MILLPSVSAAAQISSAPNMAQSTNTGAAAYEYATKYSLGAFAANVSPSVSAVGFGISKYDAKYIWNKKTTANKFDDFSLGTLVSTRINSETSILAIVGVQHLQANSRLFSTEGTFFGRYKPSDVTWKLDVVWEGYTHSFPLFLFAGAEWNLSTNWRANVLFPAKVLFEYSLPGAQVGLDVFFESTRNNTFLLQNNGRFPESSQNLGFKRSSWKAGLGSSVAALGASFRIEGGALVLQENFVKDRGKILLKEDVPNALYAKATIQFPSMHR